MNMTPNVPEAKVTRTWRVEPTALDEIDTELDFHARRYHDRSEFLVEAALEKVRRLRAERTRAANDRRTNPPERRRVA